MTEDEMVDGITDTMDMGWGELRELVMDREVWHAAIHGVAQSRTQLSSISNSPLIPLGLKLASPLCTHHPALPGPSDLTILFLEL